MQRNRLLIAVGVVIGLVGVGLFFIGRGGGTSSPPPPTGTAVAITFPAGTSPGPASTGSSGTGSSGTGASGTGASEEVTEQTDRPEAPTTSLPEGCEPIGDHDTIALSAVPPEVYDTLGVIADGPPYPFRADGGVFQNREGHLPDRARGYYLEFTVVTPGSDDRGARRLVTGECGELWYTDDHYDSFALLDVER